MKTPNAKTLQFVGRLIAVVALLLMPVLVMGAENALQMLLGYGVMGLGAAVTANQLIVQSPKGKRSLPVAASTVLYQGTLVFVNAAGYADDDTASGVNKFAGIAVGIADNSGGSAGDIQVELYTDGDFELVGASFAQTDVGLDVFGDDNYTVATSDGAASVRVGSCAGYVSATKIMVALNTDGYWQGTALTTQLTTITIADAAGTPDYALQALTTTLPYGLATAAEAITLLYVIKNLQTRMGELETKLKALGILA